MNSREASTKGSQWLLTTALIGITCTSYTFSANAIGLRPPYTRQLSDQKTWKVADRLPKNRTARISRIKELSSQADTEFKAGNYVKAKTALEDAIRIAKEDMPTSALVMATLLNNLAFLCDTTRQYDEAEPLYKESLRLRLEIHGEGNSDTAISYFNLAGHYAAKGNFADAEESFIGALRSNRLVSPEGDRDTIKILTNLADMYARVAKRDRAIEAYRLALLISKKIHGARSVDTAIVMTNMGLTHLDEKQFQEAEALLEQALLALTETVGPVHKLTASVQNSLGGLYISIGNPTKALTYLKTALDTRKQLYGPIHIEVANSYNTIGGALQRLQNTSEASLYFERALALRKSLLPEDSLETADTLSNLATTYIDQNRAGNAISLLSKAMSIKTNRLGPKHPDVARLMGNMAVAYSVTGNKAQERILQEKSLIILEASFGANHPSTLLAAENLASAEENPLKAARLLDRAYRGNLIAIQGEGQYLSSTDREGFVSSFGDAWGGVFSLLGDKQEISRIALFSRLNRQGLLVEMEKRQAELASAPGEHQSIANELATVISELASFSITTEQRRNLRLRQDDLEKKLYRVLPKLQPRIVEVEQVAAALPQSSALVEFQRYQPYNGSKAHGHRWSSARYVALVLSADGTIKPVDLGLAGLIEEKIKQALIASEQQLGDAEKLWGLVGDLIIAPLASATEEIDTLFISPDAELNRVPFAALPVPGSDHMLGDVVKLRLITTGRELLELGQPSAAPKNAALVVANPDFDQLPVDVESTRTTRNRNKSRVGQQRSTDSDTLHWSPLPATAKEGEAIANLTNARLLTKGQATASAVQLEKAPRMIHIASHAFFLADQSKTQKTATAIARSSQAGTDGLRTAAIQGENPLLRSGIALAGANRALQQTAASDDDGYLTALEVAQLDWKGTELVVISACESGRGDIRAGEGVYGLKRAIAVAGARSSLLSLWKVDDAATAAFMQSFYERLKAGTPRADALAATQKQFRQHPIPAWRHPYVWAAFQLSGDWRSIEW